MDEVISEKSAGAKLLDKVSGIFVIEPVSFSTKKRINLKGIAWLGCCFLGIFCLAVFMIPSPQKQAGTYTEQISQSSAGAGGVVGGFNQNANAPQFVSPQLAGTSGNGVSYIPIGSSEGSDDRNTSMIIRRDNDMSTTLPPGTRFWVTLAQATTVTKETMPIIGVVSSSVDSSGGGSTDLAIPEDSKIFGNAVLDPESERANITWSSILFPDGRSKNLTALAVGSDNQAGVEGDYHSDALKNTTGEVISDFAAGFAEGAMTATPFGMNSGGVNNGIFQGLANTAQNRANQWGDKLKKPRAWIELKTGARFQVVLSQPFVFRDPGGVN